MSAYLGFTPSTGSDYYFISYNTEDADRISPIVKQMHDAGVELWYDYGIEYGDRWERVISEKLKDAQAIFLFMTKGILQKGESYVQKEYRLATKFFKKKVYVIILDRIDIEDVPYEKAPWWDDILQNQCVRGEDIDSIIRMLGYEGDEGMEPYAEDEVAEKDKEDVSEEPDEKDSPSAQTDIYQRFLYEIRDDGTVEIIEHFYPCSDTVVVTPKTINGKTVTSIGYRAFSSNETVEKIIIQEGVTEIGSYAFQFCHALTEITIPGSVTTIGDLAFQHCSSLKEVTIPDSVTYIGRNPFAGCTSLSKINISSDHSYYKTIDGVLFWKSSVYTELTTYPPGLPDEKYIIPTGTGTIERNAFGYCENLKEIIIPYTVYKIRGRAFQGCSGLKRLRIPDGVDTITDYTFSSCTSLTELIIPESVTYFNSDTIYDCPQLKDIYFQGTEEQWRKAWVGDNKELINSINVHFKGDNPKRTLGERLHEFWFRHNH